MAEARRHWTDRPLVQLSLVRYLEFIREPEAIFWVFVFPVLLTAGLGIAFRSRGPEQATVAVLAGPGAEATLAALAPDGRVQVRVLDDSAAAAELRTGRIALVVVPGAEPGQVRYRFDDARADARTARQMVDDRLQRAAGRTDPVSVSEEMIREPGARYIDFLVPGLLGMNLMGTGMWGIGFAIVDQRRKRLLKRLVATPMSRAEYLAAFVVSRLGWLVLEVAVLLGFAALAFGVPLRGSLGALAGLCVLSAMAFGGLGILVAARPRTIEGASGLMNVVMFPMWIFSGVFFSASNFPDPMQPFIQALPLTAVVDALRATMLEGASLVTLGPEVAIIAAWTAASFLVGLRLFRWQ